MSSIQQAFRMRSCFLVNSKGAGAAKSTPLVVLLHIIERQLCYGGERRTNEGGSNIVDIYMNMVLVGTHFTLGLQSGRA